MNRITPEMVKEAYERTGLKPAQGEYFPAKGCACGLGVIATLHGVTDAEEYCIENFDDEYFRSFACGFDGIADRYHSQLGYEDGRAAWEAVKDMAV